MKKKNTIKQVFGKKSFTLGKESLLKINPNAMRIVHGKFGCDECKRLPVAFRRFSSHQNIENGNIHSLIIHHQKSILDRIDQAHMKIYNHQIVEPDKESNM